MLTDEILLEAEDKMQKAIEVMENRFLNVRAGRANPRILDKVEVEYYGAPTPLIQLATVSVPEARKLVIKPFDRSSIGAIEKAIFEYDYVIIDTNHDLSEKNVFLLDYVDRILLIMGNDLTNIKNMRSLIKIFDDENIKNYKILLNESISLYKNYFSLYDIKKMIEANIDYYLDNSFFIKNIDNYIYDGNIITLDKRFIKSYPKINKVFNLI